jgi:two-component system, LytTR family, response regulator
MKLRVVVADDEALARKELRRLLTKGHPEVEIVGEATDGDEAVTLIQKEVPDLVFLDIRMPGRDGFGVLDALEPPMPEIVFSTAYDQFAVDAVRRGALDYLLKPIAPEELANAVRRALERKATRGPVTAEGQGKLGPGDRAYFRDGKAAFLVEIGKVRWLESEGNYTRVVMERARPLVRRPLKYFEERLDPAHFFRANRKQIVGLGAVKGTKPVEGGMIELDLGEGAKVEVSRRQARAFKEAFRL